MHPVIYATTLSLMVLAWASLFVGGWWTLILPLFTFGVVPLAELLLSGTTANLAVEAEPETKQRRIYDWLLYAVVPTQAGLVVLLMVQIATGALTGLEILGGILTVGVSCGAFGINVGHELGHRRSKWEQGSKQRNTAATAAPPRLPQRHHNGYHRGATSASRRTGRRARARGSRTS